MENKSVWYFLDRAIGLLSLLGAVVAALALATIAVSVIWEVIARSVLRAPTIWAVEVSTYAIITAGFLGAAYVLRQGRHLEINLVTSRLSEKVQNRLGIVTDLVSAGFCILVVVYGAAFVELSQIIGSVSVSELRVPLWIPQMTIPIGFSLLTLEFLARVLVRLKLVHRQVSDPEAQHA